jgi:signal transduction histidine kinase
LINASFISRIFFTDDKTKSEIYFLKSLPLDYEKLAFSKKFGFSKILSVFSVIFLIPIILSLPNKNFYFACFILIIDLLVLNDFLLTSASYLILKNINEKFSMFSPTTLKYVIFSVAVSFFVIFTQYVYFQFSSLNLWVSKNSIFIATSPIIITFTLSKILKKKSIKLIKLI